MDAPANMLLREQPGAPGSFGRMLLCGCDPARTYCSHVEGDCPWHDREPVPLKPNRTGDGWELA